jgi:hypothetical protein
MLKVSKGLAVLFNVDSMFLNWFCCLLLRAAEFEVDFDTGANSLHHFASRADIGLRGLFKFSFIFGEINLL